MAVPLLEIPARAGEYSPRAQLPDRNASGAAIVCHHRLDIRMPRIEELNDLRPAVEQALPPEG